MADPLDDEARRLCEKLFGTEAAMRHTAIDRGEYVSGFDCPDCVVVRAALSRAREAGMEEGRASGLEYALRIMPHENHYGHWDREGKAGAACPACIDQREAREQLRHEAAAIRERMK